MKPRQNKAKPAKYGKKKARSSFKETRNNISAPCKKYTNAKFIQRSKQMEEFQRKQQTYEEKYRKQTQQASSDYVRQESQEEDDDENPFDVLLSTLEVEQELQPSKLNPNTKEITKCDESSEMVTEKKMQREFQTEHCQDDKDTFTQHLDHELSSEHVENLLATPSQIRKMTLHRPNTGKLYVEFPIENDRKTPVVESEIENTTEVFLRPLRSSGGGGGGGDLQKIGVKSSLAANVENFTPLQSELFGIINNYKDLYYPHCSLDQTSANVWRSMYCLHALNHMFKTRSRITNHNAKLADAQRNTKKDALIVPDNYRDQGLVRPKVLFIVPFRGSAFHVVNTMVQQLYGSDAKASKSNGSIINYDRFHEEYTGDTILFPKTNPKPEDYEKIFSGNTEDNFRIGISLTKKCLKLYTDFYASDILIASPLGLRLIIGTTGNSERDYDFLNSIELLVIDQAELLLAQNWENLLHVLDHLHLQPQSLRDADIRRVRPWCIAGLSRFYRQTLLLSSHELPEFRALFNSKCFNYQGKVRVSNPVVVGDIRNIILSIPQIYHRVDVTDMKTSFDQRFQNFVTEVLPRFRNASMAHCMLYVPSYFDYVRLRNYFKAESISFVQICEYTKKEKIARARDIFFHSGAHFLLYSERSHFFRRTRIKGIRHLIMYQPPVWPHFYSEMINMMHDSNQNKRDGLEDSMSVTVLYTKYDFLQLSAVLGTETATKLIKSNKTVHAFATE